MSNKIAVFVCGSGGSGKSTISKSYFPDHTIIDVDDVYEEELLKNGLGLKIKDFSENEIKLSNELFEKSKTINDENFEKSVSDNRNLVIDSIGRDPNILFYQRNYLEKMGYTTFLLMIYAELETCIDRVEKRNRVYGQNITIDSWYQAYGNIDIYKREFKDRFLLIYNENIDWKEKINVFIYKYINKKSII